MHSLRMGILALVSSFVLTVSIQAAPPSAPAEHAKLIGQPASIEAVPAAITLNGAKGMQQVVFTGRYADGSIRDLTPFVTSRIEQPELASVNDGFVRARRNGATSLIAEAGGKSVKVPLTVQSVDKPQPVSFRNDVIAGLNVGGCNAGACHGTPSGKNGFRLSLRGFDPAQDYLQLTRDVLGRRTDRLNPYASLMMQKGMGRVPHEGGARWGADTVAIEMIADWLSEGMRDDPKELATVTKIEVLPGARVFKAPARWQQLSVMGHFSNGDVRDMTRLTVFSSSDAAIAEVTPNGLVEFKQSGEVAILCRYLDQLQAVRFTYLEQREGFVWKNPPEVNYIDKFVFSKLKQMSIPPSELCTDEEFVRRAYLDLCGLLPTGDEVQKFLADKSADKRAKLIDALLERPEYSDFWALKWADVFRSSRKTIQLKGAHAFQQWLHGHMSANTPFDAIIRDMLTSNGSSYANPPANYYRIAKDPQNLAETTAQLFFGVRMQCAKCHNHPFERWTQVGSSRVDLQACKLEYSIVSPK